MQAAARRKGNTERRLTILFFAWRIGSDEERAQGWLKKNRSSWSTRRLIRETLSRVSKSAPDFGRLWLFACAPSARSLVRQRAYRKRCRSLPGKNSMPTAAKARRVGSAWLLNERARRAQDLRLRIRMEKDAFQPHDALLAKARISLQNLGANLRHRDRQFVGSARGAGGIGRHFGQRRRAPPGVKPDQSPFRRRTRLMKRARTRPGVQGERVLAAGGRPHHAQSHGDVVEQGTARRLNGVFKLSDGEVFTVGGKTGSGDNRFETFNRCRRRHHLARDQPYRDFRFLHRRALLWRDHRLRAGARGGQLSLYQRLAGDSLEALAPTICSQSSTINPQAQPATRRSRVPLPAKRAGANQSNTRVRRLNQAHRPLVEAAISPGAITLSAAPSSLVALRRNS